MYLHTRSRTQSPPCRFRFVDRAQRPGRDLSTATCDCFRWSCFGTTRPIGHQLWQKHINSNLTSHETETAQ